jgi:hypothetical protein
MSFNLAVVLNKIEYRRRSATGLCPIESDPTADFYNRSAQLRLYVCRRRQL